MLGYRFCLFDLGIVTTMWYFFCFSYYKTHVHICTKRTTNGHVRYQKCRITVTDVFSGQSYTKNTLSGNSYYCYIKLTELPTSEAVNVVQISMTTVVHVQSSIQIEIDAAYVPFIMVITRHSMFRYTRGNIQCTLYITGMSFGTQ